jgi:ABC-type multidrug transport system ATPase subunit
MIGTVENLLEVKDLAKSFGPLQALKGISFAVPRGAIMGLLGPNGAGKTTCIDILLGATLPDSGAVKYFGNDFFTHRQASLSRINFASAYHNLQNRISVPEPPRLRQPLRGRGAKEDDRAHGGVLRDLRHHGPALR